MLDMLTIGRIVALTACTAVGVRAWRLRSASRTWRLWAIGGCAVLIPALGVPGMVDGLQVAGYAIAVCGLLAFVGVVAERPIKHR